MKITATPLAALLLTLCAGIVAALPGDAEISPELIIGDKPPNYAFCQLRVYGSNGDYKRVTCPTSACEANHCKPNIGVLGKCFDCGANGVNCKPSSSCKHPVPGVVG